MKQHNCFSDSDTITCYSDKILMPVTLLRTSYNMLSDSGSTTHKWHITAVSDTGGIIGVLAVLQTSSSNLVRTKHEKRE